MAERTEELRREIAQTRDNMGNTLEQIGDRISPSRMVERRWDKVRTSGRDLRHRVMGEAQSVRHTVGDRTGSMTDQVGELPQQVRQGTQGNPLAAGAVAFGLGLVTASLAPPSRPEARMAEKVIDPLAEQAGEVGRGVAEATQSRAEQAVDETKAVASDAAAQVADQAKGAAHEVRSSAGESAEHVQQQVQEQQGQEQQGQQAQPWQPGPTYGGP